jgi:hypothetical protein
MNRALGVVFIVAALGVCVIGSTVLGAGVAGMANSSLTPAAALLGFGLLFVILVAPLGGFGIYILVRSKGEAAAEQEAAKQRKILDMVSAHGRVDISDVVIELHSNTDEVKSMIYKLVGMGVFSGYINWDNGVLYSEEAVGLRGLEECKHCGGKLTLAGKGIVKCPFCGTEYFLS